MITEQRVPIRGLRGKGKSERGAGGKREKGAGGKRGGKRGRKGEREAMGQERGNGAKDRVCRGKRDNERGPKVRVKEQSNH